MVEFLEAPQAHDCVKAWRYRDLRNMPDSGSRYRGKNPPVYFLWLGLSDRVTSRPA